MIPVLSDLASALSDSRPERANFMPERAGFRPERTDFRPERAWGGGRTDGRTNKRMNEQMKVPYVLQDFVPFEAAALPLILIYKHAKQGNGYH